MAGASADGGWTVHNIDDGVTYGEGVDGLGVAFIAEGHPLIAYFNRIFEADGEDPITEDDFVEGNKFIANERDTRKCMIDLKRELFDVDHLTKSANKVGRPSKSENNVDDSTSS